MPEVRNPGLGAGQQALLVSTVNLTAAQIRTLGVTPFTLVPPAGAGKVVVPLLVVPVYHFGTTKFVAVSGGTDILGVNWQPSGVDTGISFQHSLDGAFSTLAICASFSGPLQILPGEATATLSLTAANNYTNGPIATATLGAGGAGYAPNDTGTITTGSGDATYRVLTVDGGGAVLTFLITGAGTSYAVGNGQATAPGGAQPGVGAGFTVNITAVSTGDGTLKVVTYYQIIPVP